MGELDKPVLPEFLYRYRNITNETLSQELTAIKEQHLYCARFRDMNDPMEGIYQPARRVSNDPMRAEITHEIYEAKINIGICCFSDTKDNELMWSHYAKNYSGICVGYRPDQLIKGLPRGVHLARVAYGNSPPPITHSDASDKRRAAMKILSHKKASWGYEREWRILGPVIGRVNIASKACVREIYLGPNMDWYIRDTICSQLRHTPLRIYEMRVDGYEHTWEEIKDVKS